MKEILDSNNLKTTIKNVCSDCGIKANKATQLKRFGEIKFDIGDGVATFHQGICDFCKKEKAITETRDFSYPDFNLI